MGYFTGPAGSEGSWLAECDLDHVRRAVGQRTFEIALASGLVYVDAPRLTGALVHASLRDGAPTTRASAIPDGVRIALTKSVGVGPSAGFSGSCSRCAIAFGPCMHMATVAVDLACSRALREALVDGDPTAGLAARAPEARFAVNIERRFDQALGFWLAPGAQGARAEISATAFADADPVIARSYDDRVDPLRSSMISFSVRRAGERKLLPPREIHGPNAQPFAPKDRRVLAHVSERGSARKAVYAIGVDASLALEAMRAHGGIFGVGFKSMLDFRAAYVRPTVTLDPRTPNGEGAGSSPREELDALTASWVTAASGERITFADSVFFAGPFPYVWARTGGIYRVAPDVDLDFATHLARSPVLYVPPGRLGDAGSRLLRATRGRGIVLPMRDSFGLPPIETPSIVLRLSGEPLDLTGELVAVYRSREVRLLEPIPPADDGRDVETESRARARIESLGIVHYDEGEPDIGHIKLSSEEAIHLWQKALPDLRESADPPIGVELADNLARVRVGAPIVGQVHVALEGDWLDTRLEFSSEKLPVEIEAIRGALQRKNAWVSLEDGTLAKISASLATLLDEAADVMGEGADARLALHQLGRLDRWIEENDGRIDLAVETLRKKLRALAVAAEPDMPEGLTATLRPYQKLGLAWLQFLHALGAGGILADDMGLGKTITTLAFLLRRKELEGAQPSLVVCPTSVATNWVREAARFTPGLRVLLLHGPARDASAIAECDVVVTTYAILRRDIAALSAVTFRCAVLDEAQNIKNADSATTRAANKLDAGMRLALSGTPIENRLRELWALASFANPGILGSRYAFETRFEKPITQDRESPAGPILRAVVRPFLLRRTKDDVLRELPPKTEIEREVVLSRASKRMYDALAHTVRSSVAKDIKKRGLAQCSLSVFTALMRLRQMACDPRLVDPTSEPSASAKRESFLELVRELVAEGRRALVFSQFVKLLTLWRVDLDEEGIAYEYLDGSTTHRDEVVDRFQNGKAPLFLISLKAGGAGLNLTAADTVIHCDPWWNPAVEDQATDRAHRIGQDKPVTVVRLVVRGTIEEKIGSLKAKKRELTSVVVGGDARALEGLNEDDIRALLGDVEGEVDDLAEDGGEDPREREAPTDRLASNAQVLNPDYLEVVLLAQQWMAQTGRLETELARLVDIPIPYATRLARGEPFPCSRAVAARIRQKIRDW